MGIAFGHFHAQREHVQSIFSQFHRTFPLQIHLKDGVMFLRPNNVKLLGGKVQKLLDQHNSIKSNKKDKILWFSSLSNAEKKSRFLT